MESMEEEDSDYASASDDDSEMRAEKKRKRAEKERAKIQRAQRKVEERELNYLRAFTKSTYLMSRDRTFER